MGFNEALDLLSAQNEFIKYWIGREYKKDLKTKKDFEDLKNCTPKWENILKTYNHCRDSVIREIFCSGTVYRTHKNKEIFYNGYYVSWSTHRNKKIEDLHNNISDEEYVLKYVIPHNEYGFSILNWYKVMKKYNPRTLSIFSKGDVITIRDENEVVFPITKSMKHKIRIVNK